MKFMNILEVVNRPIVIFDTDKLKSGMRVRLKYEFWDCDEFENDFLVKEECEGVIEFINESKINIIIHNGKLYSYEVTVASIVSGECSIEII